VIKEGNSIGFSLIELLIVMSIIGIIASVASPLLQSNAQRWRLIAAAEMISNDLKWARSESIKRNQIVDVTFVEGAGSSWSYAVTTLAPLALNKAVLSGSYKDFNQISLTTNFSSEDTGFDPKRGTALDNGSINLTSSSLSIRIVLSNLGRVRICGISGYDAC
jgi:type IV fimbrial biogenesis protein FimT